MRTEPILKLKNDEVIRSLFHDSASNQVLVGTSQGRILLISRLAANAYLAGNRTIYATTSNSIGEQSNVAQLNIRYGLIDKVVKLSDNMIIDNWKSVSSPTGAESCSEVSGVFTTPVMWAGEDFGWWGSATWNQVVGSNSRVVCAIRVAGSSADLLNAAWHTHEATSSGSQSWSLDEFSIAGGYAQMKIVLTSSATADVPSVSNLVVPYYAKHASYFFLTKLSMTKGSSIRGGILTASVSVPRNTNVSWGVSGGNSADWNDFTSVTPDKLFELPENFGDRLKIGAKMLAYDDERYPSIDEFAVSFDSAIDNLINKE